MCTNPKLIQKKGNAKKSTFRRQEGEYYELSIFAECGDCPECKSKKANNWVCRNYYESKECKEKCFITLTYKNSPYFLIKKDVQNFIKRFRWELNKDYLKEYAFIQRKVKKPWINEDQQKEILDEWKRMHANEYIKTRVFYAGEYGSAMRTARPHFHIIIYGWEDKEARAIRINKKNNIVYKSDFIEKVWGKGITSYQPFGDKEAPYIALYNTAQEEFKKAYKLTRAKVNKLKNQIYGSKNWDESQKKTMYETLNEALTEMENNKKEYYAIKEFNGWSIALGWEGFIKQYVNQDKYAFKEYVLGAEYDTPSPWLKKLANEYGDISAAQEILRREENAEQPRNVKEARRNAMVRLMTKKKDDLLKWADEKNEIEL